MIQLNINKLEGITLSVLLFFVQCHHGKMVYSIKETKYPCERDKIERPIKKSFENLLESTIAPGDMLLTCVEPTDHYPIQLGYVPFWIVLHQHNNEHMLFVQKQYEPILSCLLQNIDTNKLILQIIPIRDPRNFIQLVAKMSVGTGGNKGDVDKLFTDLNHIDEINNFIYATNYTHLGKDQLLRAMHNIPQQSLKWDCGPNSAARALTIAGKNITDYASFRSSCPRSHNPNKFGTVKKTGCAVAAMGMILAPFTGGVSTFAGIAAAHCTFATDSAIPDIGPSPSQLANYLSANLSGTLYKKAVHVGESDFAPFMCMIKEDIEIHKDPVILLLFYTWKAWHYVNVIGIQNETCDTFAILDTDGLIRLITKDSLKYLAHDDYLGDPSHWFSKGSIYRYNAIRFYK